MPENITTENSAMPLERTLKQNGGQSALHAEEDDKRMTNQQAAAKAKKRWGNRFMVRNSGYFTSPEKRQAAQTTTVNARAEIKRIDEEVAARLKELDWYQELQKQRRKARERISQNEGLSLYYRFSVGKQTSFGFNEIVGQGDTWEEAFADADKREKVAA